MVRGVKVALFGASGSLGNQCLEQALEAGHELTVLVRTPGKLPARLVDRVSVVHGDALDDDAVAQTLEGNEAVLFALGVVKDSPENLCADATRLILAAMPRLGVKRFVFCAGGSILRAGDQATFGPRFVHWFASTFMAKKQRDKVRQFELLDASPHIDWLGIRPLGMRNGDLSTNCELGFVPFSGMSWCSFSDAAHAMLGMLDDDTWMRQAPIVRRSGSRSTSTVSCRATRVCGRA